MLTKNKIVICTETFAKLGFSSIRCHLLAAINRGFWTFAKGSTILIFVCQVLLMTSEQTIWAQPQPPPPTWKIVYVQSGTTTIKSTNGTSTLTWDQDNYLRHGTPISWQSPYLTVSTSGTITVKLNWVDYLGNPASHPPKWVNVRLLGNASFTITTNDSIHTVASGNANDGLDDSCVISLSGLTGSSAGRQYKSYDSSSGVITLPAFNISANASASSDTASGSVAISTGLSVEVLNHAHPINFRIDPTQTQQIEQPDWRLYFIYKWDSTSGKQFQEGKTIDDLSKCTIQEKVAFSGDGNNVTDKGKNFFVPLSPPFAQGSILNPLIYGVIPGQNGAMADDLNAPLPIAPYSNASFTATQYYQYHCSQCMIQDEWANIYGPSKCVRYVEPVPGFPILWQGRVTKDGYSQTVILK